jgi:F-type H+-transporting ATPase subunit c
MRPRWPHVNFIPDTVVKHTSKSNFKEEISMDKGLIAIGAALAIGLAACGAAISIGLASAKAFDASARQPEIAGKIQTILMTSIVFIEATAIYALVVSLLLIFAF